MEEQTVNTYILVFRDNSNLHGDMVFKLEDAAKMTINDLEDGFAEHAQELVSETWENLEDGEWALTKIINMDDIEVLTIDE